MIAAFAKEIVAPLTGLALFVANLWVWASIIGDVVR